MQQISKYVFSIAWYIAIGYFSYLMILITVQYIPMRVDVAFLNIKETEIALPYYKLAFFSHVYTSIFVLIFGAFQFSNYIRNKYNKFHKLSGIVYIFLILLISSPSGLIMAIHANGGFFSKLSFCIQAILWFVFTLLAFRYVLKKDWISHEKFMYRSYALTLSAITLRLFKWIIVSTIGMPPMDTYRIVSWLGWIFNLLLVEAYFIYRNRVTNTNQQELSIQ